MEVKIEVPKIGTAVRIDVEPDHSLDSVLEIICRDLDLGMRESWSLVWRGKEIDDYSKTVQQLGVTAEDRFQLIEKARPREAKVAEISRRRYVKYAVAALAVIGVGAAGAYYAMQPSPTYTPTPTTPTPTTTPKPTPTPTPTPKYEGIESIFKGTTDLEEWISPCGIDASRIENAAKEGISLGLRIYGSLKAPKEFSLYTLPHEEFYRFYLEGKMTLRESCYGAAKGGKFPVWENVRNVDFKIELFDLRNLYKTAYGYDPLTMEWYLAILNTKNNLVSIDMYREYYRV